jgi:hypothetical protein
MKERLSIVTDKRRRGWHFLHNLVDILVIGLSAALCGWTEFEQMEESLVLSGRIFSRDFLNYRMGYGLCSGRERVVPSIKRKSTFFGAIWRNL